MAILILGGAGYIGSHAVEKYCDMGHKVVVLDNLSTGNRDLVDDRADFYQVNLSDKSKIKSILEKYSIEGVLHFAASSLVGESFEKPIKYFKNNVNEIICLSELFTELKITNIVYSSTAAVYGEPEVVPIKETSEKNPTNPYGESKLMLEKIFKWLDASYNIKSVGLRYFNVAGASKSRKIGERHNPETHLIPIVIDYALGKRKELSIYGDDYDTPDGTCIRDYIHVVDLIDAHVIALEYLINGGESNIFNVGYNKGFSVLEIIKAVEEASGKKLNYSIKSRRVGDPSTLIADSSKITELLNWNPKHNNIFEIINDAWLWHKNELYNG